MLVFMPHPRSKGSTGYPDAIKDTADFNDEHYRGIGVRWGMGVDGSEMRLCEYRCQALLDEMNNWVADLPTPLKYMQAITETYQQGAGRRHLREQPGELREARRAARRRTTAARSSNAMKRGDYFWTSGEVLIPSYRRAGHRQRSGRSSADVEWTFPLDFVEVVWGDGTKTDRQIIPTTELPAVRQASLPDSVRRDRQEVGALRRVGHRRQRRDGAAGQADQRRAVNGAAIGRRSG